MSGQSSNTVSISLGRTSTKAREPKESIVTKGRTTDAMAVGVKEVKSLITEMRREYCDVKISELGKVAKAKFDRLLSNIEQTKGSNVYPIITAYIEETFADCKELKPETVGAKLSGCFHLLSHGSPNPFCDPLCAGSVKPPGSTNATSCKTSVALYSNSKLTMQSTGKKSDQLTVYVTSGKFHGLSERQVKSLSSSGITKVTIRDCTKKKSGSSSSSDDDKIFEGSIEDSCSTIFERHSTRYRTSHTQPDECDDVCDNGIGFGFIVIVAAIILILLVAVGMICYYSAGTGNNTVATQGYDSNLSADPGAFYGSPGMVDVGGD